MEVSRSRVGGTRQGRVSANCTLWHGVQLWLDTSSSIRSILVLCLYSTVPAHQSL